MQDLIVKTDIIPSIRSDHSAVVIYIKHLPDKARGSGHWKFNASLTHDNIYVNLLETKILYWMDMYSTIEDKRVCWELLKYEIRKFTMSFCSEKKKETNRIQDLLSAELENAHILLAVNPSLELQQRTDELSQQLREIEDHLIKGNIIRSKIQWAEQGERSTKFFFGLEKHNSVKKHMRKVEIDNHVITDPKLIQHNQTLFYEQLYKSRQEKNYRIPETFFNSNFIEKLTEQERAICDRPVSVEECEKIMHTFKNDKSPGNDGLTYEFYKKFWVSIKLPLMDCYEYAFEHNELSASQKQSIITLLEKNGKNRMLLENWRQYLF